MSRVGTQADGEGSSYDVNLFIAKHIQKHTPLREPNSVPFRLSIEAVGDSSIAETVCKAFMMRTRCFLLVLSVLLTSNCSVASTARSLKVVQHFQDDGDAVRRLVPAHTEGDELQSEDERVSRASDDEERTLKSFFSGIKSKFGWKSKGEKATAKVADGLLKRAKSTKDGDGLSEKAKTAGKMDEVSASSRKKKRYRVQDMEVVGPMLFLLLLGGVGLAIERAVNLAKG